MSDFERELRRNQARVLDVGEALDYMTPEERKRTVRLFVERMTLDGTITWSGPVRPFYERVAGVSPEGLDRTVEPLRWYSGGR